MVDVQTVSVVIAAVSVVIGVANSILTNRRGESKRQLELETRQAEFYMRHFGVSYEAVKLVHEVMYCQDWKTYDEYVEKYTTRVNLEAAAKVSTLVSSFHLLGVLVRENLIDPKFLYKDQAKWVVAAWERLKPWVLGGREKFGDPKMYEAFEWLANLMKDMLEAERKETLLQQ